MDGAVELPLLRRKKWRESFYGSLGRCLKGDPQQEVNGHHSGSLGLHCGRFGGNLRIFGQEKFDNCVMN